MKTSVSKGPVAFLYPDLDLSHLNLFKVIRDDQLVNEEDALDQEVTLITYEVSLYQEGESTPTYP